MKNDSFYLLGLLAALALLGGGGYAVYSMTRGLRNNNPGNIKYDGTPWEGLASPPSDGTFAIFTDPTFGIRALGKILSNYIAIDGVAPTITGLISRWAPPSENDTARYIADVATSIGVDPNATLNLSPTLNDGSPNPTLPALVEAIIQHENGLQPYSAATIQTGLALA